jgi:GAF domain-containing protein
VLNGDIVGVLVVGPATGRLRDLEAQLLVQIAQLTAAALERAERYRRAEGKR